jgi:hypothetical protein
MVPPDVLICPTCIDEHYDETYTFQQVMSNTDKEKGALKTTTHVGSSPAMKNNNR